MMVRIGTVSLLLLCLFAASPATAEELFKHNYVSPGDSLLLIPEKEESRTVQDFTLSRKPAYVIEMLYEFPGLGEINWEELYFSLRSISRLEEVWYFSDYAGKNRSMFPSAYVMESATKKKRIPDYDESTEFADAEVYAFLDEVELKDGKYHVNYTVRPESIQIRFQNITTLRRFIKLVNKEDFYLDFLFFEDEERLKVYIFGAYTLKNEFIVLKLLKYPYSTLAKRVYTIFAALVGGFHGADLSSDFPDYLSQ